MTSVTNRELGDRLLAAAAVVLVGVVLTVNRIVDQRQHDAIETLQQRLDALESPPTPQPQLPPTERRWSPPGDRGTGRA